MRILPLLAALLACHGAHAATVLPGPAVTPLMTRALSDMHGKEVQMLSVVYPPGGGDPVRRHDAHGFIVVVEGAIVMGVKGVKGVKGGKEVMLTAGQTFYEGPHDIHTVGRNASQSKPAKFVASAGWYGGPICWSSLPAARPMWSSHRSNKPGLNGLAVFLKTARRCGLLFALKLRAALELVSLPSATIATITARPKARPYGIQQHHTAPQFPA